MPNQKIVDTLLKLRAEETTASLQYMNHHAVFKNKNLDAVADMLEKVAIDEMKHAEKITDRLLNMDVDPKGYVIDDAPHWSLNLKECMDTNAKIEVGAIDHYNEAINLCIAEKDNITKKMLESIILDEEEHRLFFEQVSEAMENIGENKSIYGLLSILGKK